MADSSIYIVFVQHVTDLHGGRVYYLEGGDVVTGWLCEASFTHGSSPGITAFNNDSDIAGGSSGAHRSKAMAKNYAARLLYSSLLALSAVSDGILPLPRTCPLVMPAQVPAAPVNLHAPPAAAAPAAVQVQSASAAVVATLRAEFDAFVLVATAERNALIVRLDAAEAAVVSLENSIQ